MDTSSYTLTVDQDACIGCAMCEGLFKKYFRIGSDGKAMPQRATITEKEVKIIKEAVDNCPVTAIHVHAGNIHVKKK